MTVLMDVDGTAAGISLDDRADDVAILLTNGRHEINRSAAR